MFRPTSLGFSTPPFEYQYFQLKPTSSVCTFTVYVCSVRGGLRYIPDANAGSISPPALTINRSASFSAIDLRVRGIYYEAVKTGLSTSHNPMDILRHVVARTSRRGLWLVPSASHVPCGLTRGADPSRRGHSTNPLFVTLKLNLLIETRVFFDRSDNKSLEYLFNSIITPSDFKSKPLPIQTPRHHQISSRNRLARVVIA